MTRRTDDGNPPSPTTEILNELAAIVASQPPSANVPPVSPPTPIAAPTVAAVEWAMVVAKSGPLATSADRNKALAILCASIEAGK